MRIRAYLYLMAAAIMIPVVLFAGLALRLLQQAEADAAMADIAHTARRVALVVQDELADTEVHLRALAASPALASGDLDAFREEAVTTPHGTSTWIVLLDEGGRQLINTVAPAGTPLPPEPVSPNVASLFSRQRALATDLMPGRVSGRLMTYLAIPVQAGGRRYALAAGFSNEHFRPHLGQDGVPADWQVDLADRKGKLIASNLGSVELVGQPAAPALAEAAAGAAQGTLELPLRRGEPAHAAWVQVGSWGWTLAVAAPSAGTGLAQAGRPRQLAGAVLLAALACAALLATWFARMHARSIGVAVDAAVALGHGVLPDARGSRIVEIDRLLDALRQAGAELRRAQAFREHAGNERQLLLEREQQARQMAEEENRAKDQFLAMLGHELRNPLAPIGTAAQLLKMPGLDVHRARYAADVIGRQIEHMNRLLSDMLDVSRVTRGLVTLNLDDIDLRAVVERAVEQTRPLMEECQHRLELRLPKHPVLVRADQTRLTQVVANLLTNSAKYTPPRGHVQLSLGSGGDEATLTVADDGEGIAPELLPRVFDLFSQGERKPDRPQGGLGLGLALVRSLVQLHGGSVDASSPGRGGGSIFTVKLPLKVELPALSRAPLPARAAEGAAGAPQHAFPPALQGAAQSGLRIMLVDDNIDAAVSLSLLLEAAGDHLVSTYYDAASALEWAAFERPDAFILDIGLPDMNGYELARRLRALPEFAGTLLIALTGYGQLQDKVRAREAGFDLHIAKPAEPEAILAALAGVRVAGAEHPAGAPTNA